MLLQQTYTPPAEGHTPKLAHQIELETLFSNNQTISRIKREFTECKEFDFLAYIDEHAIPEDFGLALLVQMVLHKRTTLPTMVGILRHYAMGDCQLAADLILKAVEIDLCDWDAKRKELVIKFDISADVQADLDRYQYPLPMVIRPRLVTDNTETGYCLTKGSILLRDNHHEEDVCLDHINRVNSIRFSIDHDTANMIQNRWRNLDKPKPGESKFEFQKRVRAFEKYDRSAKEVITKLLKYGNEFYLTHRYDKRGRTYCQGYHVNYQGAPWNKAVIELADKEIVT
jgi:hypothetical protein